MAAKTDRRTKKRFNIPKAKILYKKEEKSKFYKRFSGSWALKNISEEGACFEIEDSIDWGDLFFGDYISLVIIIPWRKNIHLKGNVKQISSSIERNVSCIGIQFLPFGEGKYENSLSYLKKIKKLEKIYH